MYLQDYEGVYPDATDCPPFDSRQGWVAGFLAETLNPEGGTIYPYVRNPQVYVCPSDPYGKRTKLSYGMNIQIAGCALLPLHESAIQTPSSLVLLVENPFDTHLGLASSGYPGGNEWFPPDAAVPCYPVKICKEPVLEYGCLDPVACRHNNATNALFCDGHVKSHPQGTLLNSMFLPYSGRFFEHM
ncbi:MAG: hypothetical protein KatS3mg022_0989 [Armatimonadota bacterium]|nr:MAG: hypothetical protein KatS3mg022_0989 [Armatimonadota bacterium]